MPQEPSRGDLLRDFLTTFAAYLRQEGAQAVEEVISRPVRRVARKASRMAGLLGLALGLATVAGIFLALSAFHLLLRLTQSITAAYALAAGVCLLVAAVCAWLVYSDATRGAKGGDADGRAPRHRAGSAAARDASDPCGPEQQVGEGDGQDG